MYQDTDWNLQMMLVRTERVLRNVWGEEEVLLESPEDTPCNFSVAWARMLTPDFRRLRVAAGGRRRSG